MNIVEDYVSFEVAKLLKEKGFNIPCDYAYNNKASYFEVDRSNFDEVYCFRPSLAMTMKWLREAHRLKINTWYENTLRNGHYETWNSEVCDEYDDLYYLGHYDTYEEACEAGIKYCLTNLI